MTYAERVLAVRIEFPGFIIRRKSHSTFMKVLALLLFFNKAFMTSYVTTIGRWMWTPENWDNWDDETKERILRHEAVHLCQQRRLTFPLYALLYLLLPLPLGLAWFRARLEWEAYSETIRSLAESKGLAYVQDVTTRGVFISYFTSGAYGWMWPFSEQVGKWYDKLVDQIQRNS